MRDHPDSRQKPTFKFALGALILAAAFFYIFAINRTDTETWIYENARLASWIFTIYMLGGGIYRMFGKRFRNDSVGAFVWGMLWISIGIGTQIAYYALR